MRVDATSKELYLMDGSSDISIGYSMTAAMIKKDSYAPKTIVRPANHEPIKEGV